MSLIYWNKYLSLFPKFPYLCLVVLELEVDRVVLLLQPLLVPNHLQRFHKVIVYEQVVNTQQYKCTLSI